MKKLFLRKASFRDGYYVIATKETESVRLEDIKNEPPQTGEE
tara:strand:+ start:514 stop:639 length:126 start_codon:yes stop_codon:yes gene_type:complete